MDLESLRERCLTYGADEAYLIDAGIIKTRQWVRMKCQFGCPVYGMNYTCPPHVPEIKEIERFFGEYRDALVLEFRDLKKLDDQKKVAKAVLRLEHDAFLGGFHKAFGLAAGPCHLCSKCRAPEGRQCKDMKNRRPSMESFCIDVYELLTDAGCTLDPVQKKTDSYKSYGLLLIQ